jgi:uncharacterized RDD family membrane protein YckC
MWRRGAALVLDILVANGLSALVLSNDLAKLLLFLLFWLCLRIVFVVKNQGQSLGRWLLNIRVIDTRFNKTPGILELSKREGLLGIIVVLTLIGIRHLWSGNAGILLWTVPFVLDSGITLFDTKRHPQTIHDRVSHTIVIGCNRGYSLDVKLQKWMKQIDKLKKSMR